MTVDSEEGIADVDAEAVAVWLCNAVLDDVGKADPLIVAVCDDDELLVSDTKAEEDG